MQIRQYFVKGYMLDTIAALRRGHLGVDRENILRPIEEQKMGMKCLERKKSREDD